MQFTHSIKQFLKLESASGLLLLSATIAALFVVNSGAASFYQHLFHSPLPFSIGSFHIPQPLSFWINDGLMAIFFLVVGLELKREFKTGNLAGLQEIILPGLAALGGMLFPVLFFILINFHHPATMKGWSIPVATDIAFALGTLSLFSKHIPLSLKLFLLTLAIFDDIGAIFIIAIFHTQAFSPFFILLALAILGILWVINTLKIKNLFIYLLLGIVLWISVLQSGVHPTISGVLLAMMIPISRNEYESPLHQLENSLHPWTLFFIMPLFAFANSGIVFHNLSFSIFYHPLTLGIIIGLFLGKQIGVMLLTWLAIKLKWSLLPRGATWLQIYGISLLCGIGFTMSLFLGVLSFKADAEIYLTYVRVGVMSASLLSGLCGALILYPRHLNFKEKIIS